MVGLLRLERVLAPTHPSLPSWSDDAKWLATGVAVTFRVLVLLKEQKERMWGWEVGQAERTAISLMTQAALETSLGIQRLCCASASPHCPLPITCTYVHEPSSWILPPRYLSFVSVSRPFRSGDTTHVRDIKRTTQILFTCLMSYRQWPALAESHIIIDKSIKPEISIPQSGKPLFHRTSSSHTGIGVRTEKKKVAFVWSALHVESYPW